MESVIKRRVYFFKFNNSTHNFAGTLKKITVDSRKSKERRSGIKGIATDPFCAALSSGEIGGLKDGDAMARFS